MIVECRRRSIVLDVNHRAKSRAGPRLGRNPDKSERLFLRFAIDVRFARMARKRTSSVASIRKRHTLRKKGDSYAFCVPPRKNVDQWPAYASRAGAVVRRPALPHWPAPLLKSAIRGPANPVAFDELWMPVQPLRSRAGPVRSMSCQLSCGARAVRLFSQSGMTGDRRANKRRNPGARQGKGMVIIRT